MTQSVAVFQPEEGALCALFFTTSPHVLQVATRDLGFRPGPTLLLPINIYVMGGGSRMSVGGVM